METPKNLSNQTPEELIDTVHLLLKKINQRDTQLHQYKLEINQQQTFIAQLQEQLQLSKLRQFSRKSEKDQDETAQLALFDEAVCDDNASEIEALEPPINVPGHQRKKPGRKPLPETLPRIQQIHDLTETEKTCACGCALTKIGEDKTEQLDIIPAKVQIIEHIKLKYACKACENTIKTAAISKQPIPKSIASPGTLAYVAVAKYENHLPLYRQEKSFQQFGINIARNTLSHWIIKSADLLLPVYKLLQDSINSYDISFSDETRVQVLKEANKSPESQSYMWCFIGGPPDKRCIIYHYAPGRSHNVIEQVLQDFNGYLHCDGYAAYETYANKYPVKLSGCWAHARRRFVEVKKMTKISGGLANKVIAQIAKLYMIEKQIKENYLTVEEVMAYRQQHSAPIIANLRTLLEKYVNKVLPKSALGQAIHYCLNQWTKLSCYLEDGRLEIDNNRTERAIKPFVIGRKNWMFSNSVAGIKAGQIIYSIIETCKAHKIVPYAYLRYVLAKLPTATTIAQLEALLPYNFDRKLLVLP